MKWYIGINQAGIEALGLGEKMVNGKLIQTDFNDWAIIDYIASWLSYSKKESILINGEEYIWINYTTLIANMPRLNIKSKGTISKKVSMFERLGILKKYQNKIENKTYIHLTPLYFQYANYDASKQKGQDSAPEIVCANSSTIDISINIFAQFNNFI